MKKYNVLLLCLLAVAAGIGCKKIKDYDFIPERQFTPGNITIRAGETNVVLTWPASLFAQTGTTYTVEVGRDSAFTGTPVASLVTSRPEITITDSILAVRTPYVARIKANANNGSSDSYWALSGTFQITGEQLFLPLLDADITDKTVLLKWRPSAGLTRIVLTPAGGAPQDIPLTPADLAANEKLITNLQPLTQHTAVLYRGTTDKGTVTFTTKELNIFTTILKPGDDLIAAVAAAQSGDVIGLQPGTYDCKNALGEWANLRIQQKSITIASTSKTPNDTKVNYREVTLAGSGAGVILRGIHFDGLPAGAGSLYFLNFVGANSDSEPATFTNVEVDNCLVGNFGNCFLRANRAANNAHSINTIKVANSLVYDNRVLNAYTYFTLDKLDFKKLELVNSTFYNIGRAFINWTTNIPVINIPDIIIDQCTINSFGRDGRNNTFVDCNANAANIAISNSIIANCPMPGQTTGNSLVRASAAVSASMRNCNVFALTNGASPEVQLSFPAFLSPTNITNINLGWTPGTTNFSLPAGSPLRTASTTGGPIGDPRWAQ